MNNKGFAVSGVLYTILLIFITLLLMTLFNLQNKKTVLDNLKADTIFALTPEVSDSIGVKYTAYTDASFNEATTIGSNNEIAVITDLAITKGYISKNMPVNPVLGDIWVAISYYENAYITSTNIEIPIAHVSQYTSDNKWVQKKAYVSNSVTWTPLNDVVAENYVTNFAYTGASQNYSAPATGYYKVEVWGAQGGSYGSYTGGKGGYSVGVYYAIAGQSISVYVGGVGASGSTTGAAGGFNGGGVAGTHTTWTAGGGGGATHASIANNLLKDLVSNKSAVLIVAGGGGGASVGATTANGSGNGGVGGGLSGTKGASTITDFYGGTGGSQTAAGTSACGTGSFGADLVGTRTCGGAGGGGGYYSGGPGYGVSGGGGSGYIGGVTSYSGVTATTNAGTSIFTSPSGILETGHSGNGYARITFIEIG